jgi:hypothetical protein
MSHTFNFCRLQTREQLDGFSLALGRIFLTLDQLDPEDVKEVLGPQGFQAFKDSQRALERLSRIVNKQRRK